MTSLAVLLLLATSQDPAVEPSIEQELDALIARTNGLVSFRALYRLEATGDDAEEGKGSLEVVYLAPDRGREEP